MHQCGPLRLQGENISHVGMPFVQSHQAPIIMANVRNAAQHSTVLPELCYFLRQCNAGFTFSLLYLMLPMFILSYHAQINNAAAARL